MSIRRHAYGFLTGDYTCKVCGKQCRGRIYEGRGKYCSKDCYAVAKRTTMKGAANPNFRNAGKHICIRCGIEFLNYNKKSKFCGSACYHASRVLPKPPKPPKLVLVRPSCKQCGSPIGPGRKMFCSTECFSLDARQRGTRPCVGCGTAFYSPNKRTKFCSYSCFVKDGGTKRAGQAAASAIMKKYGAKKDANHKEVFDVMRQFCAVYDMSRCGFGVPDGLAYINGAYHLFDVKNPKTGYGRKGLNKIQKKWLSDWRGGPVYLIHNATEAEQFAKGQFDGLKVEKSGYQAEQDAA